MNEMVVCPDCREWHSEPAEAILGVEVRCADCLISVEVSYQANLAVETEDPRAA